MAVTAVQTSKLAAAAAVIENHANVNETNDDQEIDLASTQLEESREEVTQRYVDDTDGEYEVSPLSDEGQSGGVEAPSFKKCDDEDTTTSYQGVERASGMPRAGDNELERSIQATADDSNCDGSDIVRTAGVEFYASELALALKGADSRLAIARLLMYHFPYFNGMVMGDLEESLTDDVDSLGDLSLPTWIVTDFETRSWQGGPVQRLCRAILCLSDQAPLMAINFNFVGHKRYALAVVGGQYEAQSCNFKHSWGATRRPPAPLLRITFEQPDSTGTALSPDADDQDALPVRKDQVATDLVCATDGGPSTDCSQRERQLPVLQRAAKSKVKPPASREGFGPSPANKQLQHPALSARVALCEADNMASRCNETAAMPRALEKFAGLPEAEVAGLREAEGAGLPEAEDTGLLVSEDNGPPRADDTGLPVVEGAALPEAEDTGGEGTPLEAEDAGLPEAKDAGLPEAKDTGLPEAGIEDMGLPEARVEHAGPPLAEDSLRYGTQKAILPPAEGILQLKTDDAVHLVAEEAGPPHQAVEHELPSCKEGPVPTHQPAEDDIPSRTEGAELYSAKDSKPPQPPEERLARAEEATLPPAQAEGAVPPPEGQVAVTPPAMDEDAASHRDDEMSSPPARDGQCEPLAARIFGRGRLRKLSKRKVVPEEDTKVNSGAKKKYAGNQQSSVSKNRWQPASAGEERNVLVRCARVLRDASEQLLRYCQQLECGAVASDVKFASGHIESTLRTLLSPAAYHIELEQHRRSQQQRLLPRLVSDTKRRRLDDQTPKRRPNANGINSATRQNSGRKKAPVCSNMQHEGGALESATKKRAAKRKSGTFRQGLKNESGEQVVELAGQQAKEPAVEFNPSEQRSAGPAPERTVENNESKKVDEAWEQCKREGWLQVRAEDVFDERAMKLNDMEKECPWVFRKPGVTKKNSIIDYNVFLSKTHVYDYLQATPLTRAEILEEARAFFDDWVQHVQASSEYNDDEKLRTEYYRLKQAQVHELRFQEIKAEGRSTKRLRTPVSRRSPE